MTEAEDEGLIVVVFCHCHHCRRRLGQRMAAAAAADSDMVYGAK